MGIVTRSGRPASQHPEELAALLGLVRDEGVRSYIEVGARHGDTFYDVVRAMPAGSVAVAVDLPNGKWGHQKSARALTAAVAALASQGYAARAVFGDSTSADVISRVWGRYDLALIDGDHTLSGVTADWNAYRGMTRMVAFHDIAGEGQSDKAGNPVEVPALWKSLTGRKVEFVGKGSRMGIGVIWP